MWIAATMSHRMKLALWMNNSGFPLRVPESTSATPLPRTIRVSSTSTGARIRIGVIGGPAARYAASRL